MMSQTQSMSFQTPATTNRWIDDLIRQNKSVSVNVVLTNQGYVLTPVVEKPTLVGARPMISVANAPRPLSPTGV